MSDGLNIYCKVCLREYRKAEYARKREHIIRQQKINSEKYITRNRDFVVGYLKDNPCVDCGESDIICLEFDHVRGSKIAGVGLMISNGWSLNKIKDEIAKCEVRCANCHRRVTAARGGWYRTLV